jgi:hypothetical protein
VPILVDVAVFIAWVLGLLAFVALALWLLATAIWFVDSPVCHTMLDYWWDYLNRKFGPKEGGRE